MMAQNSTQPQMRQGPRLREDLHTAVKISAAKLGTSVQRITEDAIVEWLRRNAEPKAA